MISASAASASSARRPSSNRAIAAPENRLGVPPPRKIVSIGRPCASGSSAAQVAQQRVDVLDVRQRAARFVGVEVAVRALAHAPRQVHVERQRRQAVETKPGVSLPSPAGADACVHRMRATSLCCAAARSRRRSSSRSIFSRASASRSACSSSDFGAGSNFLQSSVAQSRTRCVLEIVHRLADRVDEIEARAEVLLELADLRRRHRARRAHLRGELALKLRFAAAASRCRPRRSRRSRSIVAPMPDEVGLSAASTAPESAPRLRRPAELCAPIAAISGATILDIRISRLRS